MAATQAAEKHGDKNEVWPDIYNEGYIHQCQPGPTDKIHYQQQKHWV